MESIKECNEEKCDRFKRTESRGWWKTGGSGGRSAFPASGEEPEGLRPLARIEWPRMRQFGWQRGVFRPIQQGRRAFSFAPKHNWRETKMIDINLIRTNPDLVRENIKKKFQDEKLPLVDEVIALDKQNREAIQRADYLRSQRNKISKMIGGLMAKGQKEEAEAAKQQVKDMQDELAALEVKEEELAAEIRQRMMVIPNIIDESVPIGKDDSENVENERFGEPVVPDFEVPYHVDIMEKLDGIDLDAARRTSGNGFYYLKGDIARLHSAILSYARDFMIDRGFTYYIPPFMIRSSVVNGVMSFAEMENMMYKIEGEDLYLIGTSEHSMIGKFIDTILDEKDLPQTLTSYSPCFRKEVGAHGIEERGVYRIHQFEKQEMIVV